VNTAYSRCDDVVVVMVTAAGSSECRKKPLCTAQHYIDYKTPCLNGHVRTCFLIHSVLCGYGSFSIHFLETVGLVTGEIRSYPSEVLSG